MTQQVICKGEIIMEVSYEFLNAKFKSEGNFTLLELVSLLEEKNLEKNLDPLIVDLDERFGKFAFCY